MAKKKSESNNEESSGDTGTVNITPEIRNSIFLILSNQEKIDILSTGLKETKKALAEKMMLKPAKFNELLALIRKEMAEGGVIPEQEEALELKRNVLEQMDLENPPKIDPAGVISVEDIESA